MSNRELSDDEKSKQRNALRELTVMSQNMGLYDQPEDRIVRCLDKGFVRYVDHMGNDAAIVQKARVSYGEGTKKVSDDKSLIRYLMRHRHSSPFEGVVFKFHVRAPIFVVRQWHRHRMWSYNEISGRYSEMPDDFYVPDPSKVTFQNPTNKQGGTDEIIRPSNIKNPDDWWDCISVEDMEKIWDWQKYFEDEQALTRQNYERYLKSGMRRELARINLPLAQYTEMYATVDLHNLFHFLRLRQDEHAQYEIRVYADALLKIIREFVPIAAQAYEDYSLNAKYFTSLEVNALQEALRTVDENLFMQALDTAAKNGFENSRERQEFLDKVRALLQRQT